MGTVDLPSRTGSVASSLATVDRFSPPEITAETAIVIDDAASQVLYAKDANRRVAPASLTKMMTAIIALEHGKLTDVVKVDVDSEQLVAETASSVMGLMPGDDLTLDQLLYGLLLTSGNDAAIAIARHAAGSEQSFVEMMNRKAGEMGLRGTHFANPHGLDEDNHYSTVYDLALIARYAMREPTIARIVGTRRTIVQISESKQIELSNGNPLIGKYFGADGVKPGFTDEAGLALAATAKRHSKRLYVVLVRSEDIVEDATKLLDHYFPLPVLPSLRTTAPAPHRKR